MPAHRVSTTRLTVSVAIGGDAEVVRLGPCSRSVDKHHLGGPLHTIAGSRLVVGSRASAPP